MLQLTAKDMEATVAAQVIVVDELGSPEEVQAIQKIAQYGVIVIASAPVPSLGSLIGNPELNALVETEQRMASGDMHTKWVITKSDVCMLHSFSACTTL